MKPLKKKVTVNVEVLIPMVPNNIKVGEHYQNISSFTDSELRRIGRQWTEALVFQARNIREPKNSL